MSAQTHRIHPTAEVHPSAIVHPSALIGEGCVIDAGAMVGPACVIGPRTRLRAHSVVVEHTSIGSDNDIHSFASLGGDPQDRAFKGDIRGELIVGDRNIFREGVTLSRATQNGPPTRIGHDNYFMAQSHVGHNCQVGDRNTFANSAVLAGHVRFGNGCVLSAFCAVHQFTNVGDGVMFQGGAMMGMHVPPYLLVTGISTIAGINKVGMKRNPALNDADRLHIKELVRAMFRDRGAAPMLATAEGLLASRAWGDAGKAFLGFIIASLKETGPRARGICGMITHAHNEPAGVE